MKPTAFRYAWLAIVAMAASGLLSPTVWANDKDPFAYRRHIHAGDYQKAASALQAAVRRHGPSFEARVDAARILRLSDDFDKAKEALNKLDVHEKKEPYANLEAALITFDQGDHKSISRTLLVLGESKEPRVACDGKLHLAKLRFASKLYQPCIDLCDKVIRDVDQALKPKTSESADYRNPWAGDLRHIQREARKLKKQAEEALIALKFGEQYLYYRKARFAQHAGRYEMAVKYYAKVDAPILKDASACYTARCAELMGRKADASRLYRAFIEAEPTGLYRGEALYYLGRMQLLTANSSGQLRSATATLNQAVDWHERIARATPPVSVASIQKILEAFPAPKNRTRVDGWGNYYRNHAGPETILNRMTSSWYLQDLQMKTALLAAFAENEAGRTERMQELLREALSINDQSGGHMLNLHDLSDRLLYEAEDGAFILPNGVWRSLPGAAGLRTRLGYFMLTTGEYGEAKGQFNQAIDTPGRSELVQAAAELGLAIASFESDGGGMSRLKQFDSKLQKSPLAPMAWLLHANILAGKKDGFEEAARRYEAVAKIAGGTLADRAMLSLAVAALNHGEPSIAAKAVRSISTRPYRDAGETLLRQVGKDNTGQDSGQRPRTARSSTHTSGGKVHTVARHLVYPGGIDLRVKLHELKDADVIDYQIAFSIRAGCSIKGFSHRTTAFDPQCLPTDESPLQFVRAPILVMGPRGE